MTPPQLSTCLAFPIAVELISVEYQSGTPNELKGERRRFRKTGLVRLERRASRALRIVINPLKNP